MAKTKHKQWVIRESCGLYVGMDGLRTALVERARATVFDERDNRKMKSRWFTVTIGGNFTIETL